MITVVIPYFQREPGILLKAVNSVLVSEGVNDVKIIVVDDQSPVSAKDEIATLGITRFPITVIEQPNVGPGGARNKGLDNLSADTVYVAFLDSDDIWSPKHLQKAMAALSAGYDVYFCDLIQLGAETSAFQRAGRITPSEHPMIAGASDLHAYVGDMFDQIITGNVIGTPTVVLNYSKFSKLRFRTDLTSAGEDYLFWLDLTISGARFSFGSQSDVRCGRGVNVYAGSGWGTDGHALRIFHELTYRKALIENYTLTQAQKIVVINSIKLLCDCFLKDFFHRLFNRKKINWRLQYLTISSEPKLCFRILPVLLESLFRKK